MSDVKSSTKKQRKGKKRNGADWRLLHEQETRQRREALLDTFMKDKITREEHFTKLNNMKLDWHWRSILRQIKSDELKAETIILQATFEHLLSTKNRIIFALLEECEEFDSHQQTTIGCHMDCLDTLLTIQQRHLDHLENDYRVQKIKIVDMLSEETKSIRTIHESVIDSLQKLEESFNEKYTQWQSSILAEFQSRKDELLNKSLEDQHALRIQLNLAIEGLWTQLQQQLKHFQENTKEKRALFNELRAKDFKNNEEISFQHMKILKLEENVLKLKRQLNRITTEDETSSIQLQEQEDYHTELGRIREQVKKSNRESEKITTYLTVKSNDVISYFQDAITKGKQVLKMKAICEKHRAISEAIRIPTVLPPSGHHKDSLILKSMSDQDGCQFQGVIFQDKKPSEAMEHFWRYYNMVYLETQVQKEVYRVLAEENVKLKNLLKHYLQGLAPGMKLPKIGIAVQ